MTKSEACPRKNQEFLNVISNSFKLFLEEETSRSTAKLKPLHGAIAADLDQMLGQDYCVKAQGYGENKEGTISGRYIDKKVDITIYQKDNPIAGIAVKFVMQNYSQNANNYFENMLGETANIRSEKIPYFQIFIIFDKLPYYRQDKTIKQWETFSGHYIKKYQALSKDDANLFFHTPDKTLIFIVHIPENNSLQNASQYMTYYKSHSDVSLSQKPPETFGSSVILNDYPTFIEKVYHTIKSL